MVSLDSPKVAVLESEVMDLLPEGLDIEPARLQHIQYALRRATTDGAVFPTFQSFIQWVDEDTSAEWEDGEVFFMSPASLQHQLLVGFLSALLRFYAEHHNLGIVLSAPFKLKLAHYAPEPDIIFVSQPNAGRIRNNFVDGPADLVIEITSPESRERDRIKKFKAYENAGIPEYWLIDPEEMTVEFYRLSQGRFYLNTPEEDGWYSAQGLPGFQLRVAWLFHTPLPKLVDVLTELKLI